jgi:two-component system cell cycle response regulator
MKDTVLIVDDSPHMHKIVGAYLHDEQIVLQSAYDGETAISAAAERRPSLILLDVDMPQLDGFEVCRRLRANPATHDMPVMFVTADGSLSDKVKGLNLGAVDYITKPFKPEELQARVQAALRSRRQLAATSLVDRISGMWNESYLQQHLPAQLSLARRSGKPLACVAANIDGLQRINLDKGQSAGDDIVRAAAHILLSHCRAEDIACHCNEKMVLLLPGTSRMGAAKLADRARMEIERQLRHRAGTGIDVTCSFGVSDTQGESDVSILDRADAALHRAKQTGGNKVALSRPSQGASYAA